MRKVVARLSWFMVLAVALATRPAVAEVRGGFAPFPVARPDGSAIAASVLKAAGARAPVVLMLQGSNCASERDDFASLTGPWLNRYTLLFIPKPGAREDGSCG